MNLKTDVPAFLRCSFADQENGAPSPIGESKLADNLTDIQRDIDLHLDAIRVDWLRLATADFDRLERKRIRDHITQQEADLMILLERKWAMERDQM